ncbi:cell division protein FtsQ/DivIB [Vagococcus vulneris]|uniref:Cell division protein DivIB n=1 Tax=Vagococcus vulneris TaxID=1977869 RepID=A0A429ZW86_9ENTE|nr:cell division protein FtsQ/DivIB [Vagococcus vulneris]RST98037.1 hypothetical protein CBF37_09035 [Vagococcus vulneris]
MAKNKKISEQFPNTKNEVADVKETKTLKDNDSKKQKKDKNHPQKKINRKLTWFLGILTVAVFINLYFISPISKVQKVIFSGQKNSTEEELLKNSKIKIGTSIWTQYFEKTDLEKDMLKNDKRIKTASISLAGIDRLKVTVSEYLTIGYFKQNNQFYEVLSDGNVIDQPAKQKDSQLPIFINFKKDKVLKEFTAAYNQFDKKTQLKIQQVETIGNKKNPYKVKMKLKDGNEIIGLSNTLASKMPFYEKIAKEMKEKGVIDMEAGASGIYSYPYKKTEDTASNSTTSGQIEGQSQGQDSVNNQNGQ